jgi:hypothetical protein
LRVGEISHGFALYLASGRDGSAVQSAGCFAEKNMNHR